MRLTFNKRFTTSVERTPRILEIAESFGLGLEPKEFVIYDNLELDVPESGVVACLGNSGGGKSLLLRDMASQLQGLGKKVVNFTDVKLEDKALIDSVGETMFEATQLLAAAGISDAYLYLRRPHELSDGQRFRATLARLLEMKADVVVVDEFCALLDRPTACAIAFMLQKLVRQRKMLLIIATTHLDLINDLQPDLTVIKRFREKVDVKYGQPDNV